jgi:hypothetical protein
MMQVLAAVRQLPSLKYVARAIGSEILKQSAWQIPAPMNSATLSIGQDIEPFSVDYGGFQLTLANQQTRQRLMVTGVGAGAGVGEGLNLGVTLSFDVPGSGLPGLQTPLFLGPAGRDSMGASLFKGVAVAVDLSGGDGVAGGISALLFLDNAVLLALGVLGPFPWWLLGLKAWTVAAGFDFLAGGASAGADELFYYTQVTPC